MADLRDHILNAAIAEAYTLAPADVVILQTLEFRHQTFAQPVRIVADPGEQIGEGDGYENDVFGWALGLEATAKANPGATVLFQSCMFEFKRPDQREGELPSVDISIDNVMGLVSRYLDQAVAVRAQLQVTYREFLLSNRTHPDYLLDGLIANTVSSSLTRVTLNAGFGDLTGFNFPKLLYRPSTHPSLAS
jgi:hypothetical protein